MSELMKVQIFETGGVRMRKLYEDGDIIVLKKIHKCQKCEGTLFSDGTITALPSARSTRIMRIAFILAIFVIYSTGVILLAKSSSKVTVSHTPVSCDNSSVENDSDIVQVETLHDGIVEISRKNIINLCKVHTDYVCGDISDYHYDQETKYLTIKFNNDEESTYYLP